jgi:Transposase DDE domain
MSKKTYRVRNWKQYNRSLVQRGRITLWVSEDALQSWYAQDKINQPGRPQEYSDQAILCALSLKAVYRLPFRGAQGFLDSLLKVLKIDLKAPDYTLMCKRQKHLKVDLPKAHRNGEGLHIVVDSTGLKVFGEGEWKVRQHGYVTKRLWRKLHLAINSKTQIIEASELTELKVQDCEGFSCLVDAIEEPIDVAIGDGAYDRFSCYEVIEKRGGFGVFPPQHNAVTSDERRINKKKASAKAVAKRDEAIRDIRSLGREDWKNQIGYHRRSLAETGMFRVKTILGRRLSSHHLENQIVESRIWCSVLNTMTLQGMPETVAI